MSKVLGILNFEPSYVHVRGLEDFRPISATSILGRYRIIDFMLSNFTNSSIESIKVFIKNRPRSTVEHISHTSYNLNSKRGKIQLLHGDVDYKNNELFNVDVQAFKTYMDFIDQENASYVVVAPSHFIFKQDFNEIIDAHIKAKNDITILCHSTTNADKRYLMGDLLTLDENKRVTEMHKNRGTNKKAVVSLETYVMSALTFKQLVEEATMTSSLYSFSDIIADCVRPMKIGTFQHRGFVACISTLNAYYDANMEIKNEKEMLKLINEDWPIYTMTNDSCPTLYKPGAKVTGSIVANGCQIEGTVINSVIGRNVVIKEGAVIKDSVILPDTFVDKNVKLECAVVDRLSIITHIKDLKGTKEEPIYIKRGDRI